MDGWTRTSYDLKLYAGPELVQILAQYVYHPR